MRKETIEEKGSLFLLSILIIMFISLVFFTVLPQILNKMNLSNELINNFFGVVDDSNIINVDYEKLYPFEEKKTKKKSFINKYKDFINNAKLTIEDATSKKIFRYESIVEYSYLYNNLLKFNLNSNSDESTISLGNNYFSKIYSEKNIDMMTNSIIDFSKFLLREKVDFLYVQAPFKISNSFDLSPIYKDSTDKTVDKFLNSIEGKVNYLDLRKQIKDEKLDNLSLFFETDHHWLPETGLWATNIISNYLNEKYYMNLLTNNLDIEKYDYKIYSKMYLGGSGRQVSLAKAIPDDFTLISPKYETKLHILIPSLNIDKIGNYNETLIDWSQLKYGNYYKTFQYASYMYGEKPLIEIHNELVTNNKKILLIKDSFSEVVAPFIALENEYLSIIDLREFNGSLKKYIKKYNPDLVIIMYNGDMLSGDISKNRRDRVWIFD